MTHPLSIAALHAEEIESAEAPRVYIETYGCSFNVADGEAMAGVLTEAGFRLAESPGQAEVVVLNTCTVKNRTYLNFQKRLRGLRRDADAGHGPAVVLAGCVPRANRKAELVDGVSAIGPDTIGDLPAVVRATLRGGVEQRLAPPRGDEQPGEGSAAARETLPTRRANPLVEILPISSGCLSACTFCQTRLARGRLHSFRLGDLLRKARAAIGEGVREIWITSQDTGAYGRETGYSLARLLGELCALEGDHRIRLGMTSPIWIWEDLDEILDALAHPRMFQFLHVPAQSGSDAVLAHMKRGNTRRQFIEVCHAFRERFPRGGLMTDLIVGYPTETEADFEATMDLVSLTRPSAANRSKFSARPGTPAARLTPLPERILSERSARLHRHVRDVARDWHSQFVGEKERVLTIERKKPGVTLAHTPHYRPAIIEGEPPLGRWVEVRHHAAANFHFKSQPMDI